MATVHLGRLEGVKGFARVVAIKRLHPHLAANKDFADRFFEEAKLASRVRHANVVQTIDVALDGDAGLVVMEYVHGETLGRLLQVACRSDEPPPPPVIGAIMSGVLHGLHAAHEATNPRGMPLGIVHRDVSPQNILVGSDGIARVLDFGIAKATSDSAATPGAQLKGKLAYMAPEQLRGQPVSPSTDIFAAAVVLWESLVGRRLFLDETEAKTLSNVLRLRIEPPSALAPSVPAPLDLVVLRGLERERSRRFGSAREMAIALEAACPPASSAAVGAWMEGLASEALAERANALRQVETRGDPLQAGDPTSNGLTKPAPRFFVRRRLLAVAASTVVLVSSIPWLLHGFGGRAAELTRTPAAPKQLVESSALEELNPPSPMAEPPPVARPERIVGKRKHSGKPEGASADCNPPYTYNPSGHKVFKPQCL
jgi:eukaryotic-like serine/threonine-protein kinase